MRHPRLIIVAFDDWLADQLAPLVHGHRWLTKEARQLPAALAEVRQLPRPTVLIVQFDPRAENVTSYLQLLVDAQLAAPETALIAISDVKLNEDDRSAWTATLLDLGVRLVLFPPLSRPVLEDAIGGLMGAIVNRETIVEEVIDLAREGAVE